MYRTTLVHFGFSALSESKTHTFYQKVLGIYLNRRLSQSFHTKGVSTIVIGVHDIDEALKRITSFGGAIVRKKERLNGIGTYALVQDPYGHCVNLFQAVA